MRLRRSLWLDWIWIGSFRTARAEVQSFRSTMFAAALPIFMRWAWRPTAATSERQGLAKRTRVEADRRTGPRRRLGMESRASGGPWRRLA